MTARRARPALFAAAAVLLAAAALVAAARPAAAHSNLESSDPAAGSSVPVSPRHIVLTFSEKPDADLSLIRVIDADGATVPGVTPPQAVPGGDLQLRVTPSRPLADGVYTVNWRVVSAVDGHVEKGAFAFGVGETPAPGSEVVVDLLHTSTWATVMASAGKWLLYLTLALLVGAASTSLFVFGARLPGGAVAVLRWAVAGAVVGWCLVTWAERALIGVEALLPLFASREGELLLALGVALVFCIGAVVAVDFWPARWSLWLLGASGAAAMLAHVLSGHAASPSSVWPLTVVVQWVHMTAVGVWIGGLFWLLLGLRPDEAAARARAIGAFTRVATITLVVVLATGVARAVGEVGSTAALTGTDYGVTLLVKVGMVVALVVLGALNHFVWGPRVRAASATPAAPPAAVPAAGGAGPAARRFALDSGAELVVALAVLAATAVLSGLAPAPPAVAARAVPAAVATGSDYATTVRVQLTVTPGAAGENTYEVWVDDYDSGDPLASVTAVLLECSLPARPSLSAVSVALARDADGAWRGRGLEFSVAGRWDITAVVTEETGGVTVPLRVDIRPAPRP